MFRSAAAAALLLAFLAPASLAHAGVYTDDLSKCLVKSTSDTDKTALVTWVYSAISLHPSVRSYTNISAADRAAIDKHGAQLFERLLTVDCRTESVAALKYEGASALSAAFEVLGNVAARGLMSDPEVAKGMDGLAADVDQAKIAALVKEAGVTSDSK